MSKRKKQDPRATVVKGLRIPAWLVEAIEAEARANNRKWSAQVTYDLMSIPRYKHARPKKKVKAS